MAEKPATAWEKIWEALSDQVDLIDLNDPVTWPDGFSGMAERAAATGVHPWHDEADETAAIEALGGHRLLAFHSTRLTKREIESVGVEGLIPLSADFLEQRLRNAVEDGHLTAQQAMTYENDNWADRENRRAQVCFHAARSALLNTAYFRDLWGGEALAYAHEGEPTEDPLRHIGTPTVIIAGLDLRVHTTVPKPNLLYGAVEALADGDSDIVLNVTTSICPAYILAVEQPGGPFWKNCVRASSTS